MLKSSVEVQYESILEQKNKKGKVVEKKITVISPVLDISSKEIEQGCFDTKFLLIDQDGFFVWINSTRCRVFLDSVENEKEK